MEFEIDVQDGRPTEEDLHEFLSFYNSDPDQNTLEQNSDGEKMAILIEKAEPKMLAIWQERDPESYLRFMISQNDEHSMLTQYKWVGRACGFVTVCTLVKCWFGGLANSICLFCTTVSVLCAAIAIFGWG